MYVHCTVSSTVRLTHEKKIRSFVKQQQKKQTLLKITANKLTDKWFQKQNNHNQNTGLEYVGRQRDDHFKSLATDESEEYFLNQTEFFENDVKQIFARIKQKLKAANKSSGQIVVMSEFAKCGWNKNHQNQMKTNK